jgi:hypothetical protein
MTVRELLELAAKAAGFALEWDGPPDLWQPMFYKGKTYHEWNPLTDDGDALRLAVALKLNVFHAAQSAYALESDDDGKYEMQVRYIDADNDPYAATRRAIVRAAAEIGRAMP